LPGDNVLAVFTDHNGTLWVATGGGVVERTRRSKGFVPVDLPTQDGQRPIAATFFEDSGKRIWIGTQRHGVYLIGADRGRARAFQPPGASVAGAILASARIRAINEVRRGQMWFGTYDHGIISLDVATKQLGWMQNDPAIPTSLPQNDVFAIYRDRAGLVWVGTLGGLRRSDPRQTGISTIVVGSPTSPGIGSSDVTAIFAAGDEHVWLGFGTNGIDIVDPIRGRIRALRPQPARPRTALPDTAVRAIAGFPRGPVYIGTDRGLYEARPDGGGLIHIPMPGNSDDIGALCIDSGVVWIGTESHGVWRLDPHARAPRRLTHTGLADNRITVIAPAARGHLWIGTFSGLELVDTRSDTVQRIRADDATPSRLGAGLVASVLTDRQGRIWVGTFGSGIEIIDHLDRAGRAHFVQLSRREGLPNVNVDILRLDRQGHIWAATDDGLAVIDPATLAIRTLHRADGVELSGYYVGAGTMLDNGELFFGSTGGVTIVRPSLVHSWTYAPPVVVTDVRTGGKPVVANAFNHGGSGQPVIVSPQANSLAVEFAALDFSAPDQNRYAYRLDGFDADWTETDPSRRLAAYTNLPPGSYRLELRGSNRNGVWSSPALSIPVRVLPAWHQTIAFMIAEAAVVLLALASFVQIRTSYLRRRERELEQQVSERTVELQALALELGESKKLLEQIAYRDPLTDLPNRRMFTETFDQMLASAVVAGSSVAILLIDLDCFKLINDQFGHDAGDALLIEAALRLRSAVRGSDCVARLGGDEFAMLLADDDGNSELELICERIVTGFAVPIVFNGIAMQTSASIGIAVFPEHGATQDELYKSADIAMYTAKRAGRNTWRRFGFEHA
jgi:diguanylate cyclase (GGDEF)-like protein